MSVWTKTLCIVVAVLVVAYLAGDLAFSGLCGNEVISTSVAPGGEMKAVLFIRNCGATTDYSTQISVVRSTERLLNRSGNAFVSDLGPHDSKVLLDWTDAKTLVVRHHPSARLFYTKKFVRGVSISFVGDLKQYQRKDFLKSLGPDGRPLL
jgi:hypothetical protein